MARARTSSARTKDTPVDKQLERYRSMRHFDVTAEPAGSSAPPQAAAEALPFVIQKHAASHLHYDFRLGWNGVLKSWAVAKGPSYFPGDKRLAVQVEDHPMEYGGFEGIIPKGQYGGGTVMLWDRGTWEPHGDVNEGLRKGSLKFTMNGDKMHGKWALVRMAPRPNDRSGKPNWLLIKEHDEFEQPQDAPSIEEAEPNSVLTGRDLDGIAHDQDRVWKSNREEKKPGPVLVPRRESKPAASPERKPVAAPEAADWSKLLKGAPKEKLPDFIPPQLATLAKAPPAGDRWVHEIKLDGYRIQMRIEKGKAQLLTRNGLDWTHRMRDLAEAASQLPVKNAILDGEVVVLTTEGTSSFADLQAAFQEGTKHHMTYFAFDLLHLDGKNLRDLPLIDRKNILQAVLAQSSTEENIRLSEHLTGEARQIFSKACELGTEGIVSKLIDATYSTGRGSSWVKSKCYQEQELVIGGFTLPTNGIHGVGALVLGYHRDGKLIYAGRTGTGFTQKTHKILRDKLEALRIEKKPFAEIPRDAIRGSIWVKPELVAQVSFTTWTADNLVRQASFKGLREDKPASKVVREMPQDETSRAASPAAKEQQPKEQQPPKEQQKAQKTAPKKSAAPSAGAPLPIRLTHPEKVLDVESGVTKEQLARYYMEVAPYMLPHIANRPLTLVRCVDGSGKPCFYQKHTNKMLTGGFKAVPVRNKKTGVDEPYITLDSEQAIVQLAQVGVLEVHPWGSHNETMEQPDRIVIDLDPDAAIDWHTLTESAQEVRKRLKALGLKSWVKTTGGKGLHVVFPVRPEHEWPEVKQWTHEFVNDMARDYPTRFLTKMSKAARVGKIFLDYLRNDRNATAVAPFSPRARAGLPVAVPLSWTELDADQPPRFQVVSIEEWRKRLTRDPWKDMPSTDQRLPL